VSIVRRDQRSQKPWPMDRYAEFSRHVVRVFGGARASPLPFPGECGRLDAAAAKEHGREPVRGNCQVIRESGCAIASESIIGGQRSGHTVPNASGNEGSSPGACAVAFREAGTTRSGSGFWSMGTEALESAQIGLSAPVSSSSRLTYPAAMGRES
jgi:hypothetical protein